MIDTLRSQVLPENVSGNIFARAIDGGDGLARGGQIAFP